MVITLVNLSFLSGLAFLDFRYGVLPNRVLVPYFLMALFLRIPEGWSVLNDLGWALVAVALLWPLWITGWLGGGDLKVVPGLVLMTGAEGALRVWTMSLVLSLCVMVTGTLIRRRLLRRMPLGLPLLVSTVAHLFWR